MPRISLAMAGLAATALVWVACQPPDAPPISSDALVSEVQAALTLQSLERHARAITMYERPSGGVGENAAIDSIVASLRADGVPVTVHEFDTYASDPVAAEVSVPGTDLRFEAITMAYSGAADGLVAPLVDVGTLADLPGLEPGTGERLALEGDPAFHGGSIDMPDVRGRIALVEGQPRNGPQAVLELAGAAGIIFSNPEERLNDLIVTSTWGTPSLRSYQRLPSVPSVQISKSAGDELRRRAAAGAVQVRISAEVVTGRKPLRLAVARIEAADAEAPYVLLGGHIDGWYFGGTDEGASNAAMVELAKAFHANRDQLRRGLVVAWWPGHSNARYAGSTWFADHFFGELRDRAVAYMNIDGVGQIDADRLGVSATAAMNGLAAEVLTTEAGVEDVRAFTPGRNSDQAFNGVGLPLLQFNQSRPAELGGYWWWHTPDDTYDKIDLDVLMTATRIYARAIARLLIDPVLPIDMVAEVQALGALVEGRQEESGGGLDLGDALRMQQELLAEVMALQAELSDHAGPASDRGILRVLRPLYRVTYDPVDPFHPDPGWSVGLLPGLSPARVLAEEDPGTDRYLFAETTLVRERNRLLEALSESKLEAERLRAALRD
jgi:Iap family predicted aminopeptidase